MEAKIIHHPERVIHPYTIWVGGEVVKFCRDQQEAEEEKRRYGASPSRLRGDR